MERAPEGRAPERERGVLAYGTTWEDPHAGWQLWPGPARASSRDLQANTTRSCSPPTHLFTLLYILPSTATIFHDFFTLALSPRFA